MIKNRMWVSEDVQHLDDIIEQERAMGALALPGLESVRDQIALRVAIDTKYENHDNPEPKLHF